MIARITGEMVEKKETSLVVGVGGLFYEVYVPVSVLQRIEDHVDKDGRITLVTHHYFQIGPVGGIPILVGFLSEIERDFFLQFIKVSGIGPRAAVKALNQPISEISRAIDEGDQKFLKGLPGIGLQRAREIIAKLQGKIGKYGLIQDRAGIRSAVLSTVLEDWQKETLDVLIQLQYKKPEARHMIEKALERNKAIRSSEDLLNEIYQQRIHRNG